MRVELTNRSHLIDRYWRPCQDWCQHTMRGNDKLCSLRFVPTSQLTTQDSLPVVHDLPSERDSRPQGQSLIQILLSEINSMDLVWCNRTQGSRSNGLKSYTSTKLAIFAALSWTNMDERAFVICCKRSISLGIEPDQSHRNMTRSVSHLCPYFSRVPQTRIRFEGLMSHA